MSLHTLDEEKTIRLRDPSNMLSAISSWPEQLDRSWREARATVLPTNYLGIQHVAFLGMGGSSIGGTLIKSLLPRETVPIALVRDYQLPSYVGSRSLVIGVSYSGDTEETVTAFEEAGRKGAKLIAVTTGGELARLASRFRAPLFRLPAGLMPRAALGSMVGVLLSVASRLGLLEVSAADIETLVAVLAAERDRLLPAVPFAKNPAKRLAGRLADRVVVVVGNGALAEVARRWKTQINENAKQAAYVEVVPELCHNTIVGLDVPHDRTKQPVVVFLSSRYDHARNLLRMKLVPSLFARRRIAYEVVTFEKAESPLSEALVGTVWGDFVSYYLALLNGVDPTPVPPIDQLKQELAKYQP